MSAESRVESAHIKGITLPTAEVAAGSETSAAADSHRYSAEAGSQSSGRNSSAVFLPMTLRSSSGRGSAMA